MYSACAVLASSPSPCPNSSLGKSDFLTLCMRSWVLVSPCSQGRLVSPLWSSWRDSESAINGTAVYFQINKWYTESMLDLLFFFSVPRLQSLASSRSKLLRPETQTYSEVRKKSGKHTLHIGFSFFVTSWCVQTRVVKYCKPPRLNPFCMVQNFNQSYYSSSQSL